MNLNQYSVSGSHIRWRSDNEPLFGPQNSPKLIVSVRLGNSVEFKVRRRALGEVHPLRFGWTMLTSWSWTVWPNRRMNIARRPGCRVLGLTLHFVGSHNTLRPVHLQAWWVVFLPSRVPDVWDRGK